MQLINPYALSEYATNKDTHKIDANDIMRFPMIEAEPVRHGHWIYKETDYPVADAFYICSECGYSPGFEINNYCPYCGAKMIKR